MIYIVMIYIVTVSCLIGLHIETTRKLYQANEVERARVHELLELIEAQKAPETYYAQHFNDSELPGTWVSDDTGLIGWYNDPSGDDQ